MKILACADIHGQHETYAWLARCAGWADCAALVLAGDLLGCPDGHATVEDAQRADAAAIAAILREIDLPVLYIMGNDDLVEFEPGAGRMQPLHGRRLDIGRYNFVGYRYSLPFIGEATEKPEDDIARDLIAIRDLVDENTVLVTHSPAFGILDVGILGLHAGSTSLRDLVENRRPRVHVHGHVHSQFGRDGRHFNVAAERHRRAVRIDLETLEAETLERLPASGASAADPWGDALPGE